ncbi:uncharacterized protein [Dysidea avara]|uniref:uncharacterized protein isoform X2 n=1 Tax=Dysidea avara TaxID=196820 RepID=UPI00332B760A
MALVVLTVVVMQMAVIVWGQSPIIPSLPPPPTYSTKEPVFVVSIGELTVVPEDIQVVFDCGELIDNTTMKGGVANITWYKNGRIISNNSTVNGIVAADKRTVEFTYTIRSRPAQTGTGGIYSCEVCTNDKICQDRTTVMDVCLAPHLDKRSGTLTSPHRVVIIIRCGQDYEAETFVGTVIVLISCPIINGTDTTLTAYKDGVEIDEFTGHTGILRFGPIPHISDNIFGTYTFVTENNCGRDVAVTRITRKGTSPLVYHNLSVGRRHVVVRAECPGEKSSRLAQRIEFRVRN